MPPLTLARRPRGLLVLASSADALEYPEDLETLETLEATEMAEIVDLGMVNLSLSTQILN